jgi:hypothetical protein
LDRDSEELVDWDGLNEEVVRMTLLRLQGTGTPIVVVLGEMGDELVIQSRKFKFLVGLSYQTYFSIGFLSNTMLSNYSLLFQPFYSSIFLRGATRSVQDLNFPYQTIVPHSGILSWLHYFSPAAIAQHKLERLFDNPYLKVSAVGEGHLFEVLEDPFEINTPEGEAKVIAANKWMLEH